MVHAMTFEEVIADACFLEEDLLEIDKQLKELMLLRYAGRFNRERIVARLDHYFNSCYDALYYYYELGNYGEQKMISLGEQLGKCEAVREIIKNELLAYAGSQI